MSRAAELDPEGLQPLSEKERNRLESARQGQPCARAGACGRPAPFSLSRRLMSLHLACMGSKASLAGPALSSQLSRAQSSESSGTLQSQAGDTYAEVIRPPKTLKRPHKLVSPDGEDTRKDDYYWLRDDKRENPEVIQHLEVRLGFLLKSLHVSAGGWMSRCF